MRSARKALQKVVSFSATAAPATETRTAQAKVNLIICELMSVPIISNLTFGSSGPAPTRTCKLSALFCQNGLRPGEKMKTPKIAGRDSGGAASNAKMIAFPLRL